MSALSAVLEESTDVSRLDSPVCPHHEALVRALSPRDTIISFNYDCVIDHALRTTAVGEWSAKYGYTFDRPSRVEGHENWSADDPPTHNETVHLLKLHGSLHWQLPERDTSDDPRPIKLKQKLYQQRGTPRFTIIPPENVKRIDENRNIRRLWTHAERAIRTADTVALVGFSFTPTDLHVDSLFRFALADASLKRLVIANPSPEHRRKIRAIFSNQLRQGAIVRQYDTLEDLAGALPDAFT